LGLLATASAAQAADVRSSPAKSPWDGVYLGFNAGVAMLSGEVPKIEDTDATPPVTRSVTGANVSGSGVIGGLQGGVNAAFGAFVVGLEADGSYARARPSKTKTVTVDNVDTATVKLETGVSALMTLRGRAGFAFADNTLLYGTAGFAMAKFNHKITYADGSSDSDGKVVAGYAVGGGVEQSLGSSMSLRAEYLYSGFSKKYDALEVNNKLNIFRLGLNVKL
jgi:outer membrane immunogenic protein